MVSEKVTIVNPSGLHLLNAVNLSNSVSRYKSSMSFTYENNGMQGTVNLKSILSIVAAGIRQGDINGMGNRTVFQKARFFVAADKRSLPSGGFESRDENRKW